MAPTTCTLPCPAAAGLARASASLRGGRRAVARAASGRVARVVVARTAAAAPASAAQRGCTAARRGAAVRAATAEAAPAGGAETFEYQAEVNRLMDLIVNSLYSNKDVFLRELVSNASDALDKIRFISLSKADALSAAPDLKIRIKADKAAKTLTIEDTGVGMTRAELVDSLGTIARSGTAKFMEAMKANAEAGGDANLIGRFGVGFYSAFLVSDKITVISKSNDDAKTWVWESALGSSSYSIRESDEALPRGTRIVLSLKADAEELLEDGKCAQLVKTYSEFISFPIEVWSSEVVDKPVVDEAATSAARSSWQQRRDAAAEKGEAFAEAEPSEITKTEYDTVWGWKVQNSNKPIWMRSPKEVPSEDYAEFFKATFREFLDPLAHAHFSIEGDIEFRAILYVPGMAPFDQQDWQRKSRSMKLYVRRVFISDQFDEDLMPRYLSFVKGVVDSSDLPLNVSREILQESKVVRVMRKRLVRKSLDMVKELAEAAAAAGAPEEARKKWDTFWGAFGRNIKLGIIEDTTHREELAALCMFASSASGGAAAAGSEGGADGMVSLKEYVARMREGQKDIYYLAADSRAAAERAPFLEALRKRGLEVLFLLDPIDEVAVTNLGKFGEHALVDITKEGLELPGGDSEAEKAAAEATAKEYEALTGWLKEALAGKVESVTVSARVTDSPCVLVTSKFGWSANMERIMKSQTMGDARAMEYMKGRKIMEINPANPIIRSLKAQVDAGTAGDAARATTELLYETSLLTSGFSVESPAEFAARVFAMMGQGLEGGSGAAGGGSTRVSAEVVDDGKAPGSW